MCEIKTVKNPISKFLEDGRINAVGSHETLLASNQIYQDIYYSQQEGANL